MCINGIKKHDVLEQVLPLNRILAIVRTICSYIQIQMRTHTRTQITWTIHLTDTWCLPKNDKRKLHSLFVCLYHARSRALEHIVWTQHIFTFILRAHTHTHTISCLRHFSNNQNRNGNVQNWRTTECDINKFVTWNALLSSIRSTKYIYVTFINSICDLVYAGILINVTIFH